MFKIGTLADWFGVGLIQGIKESEKCGAEGIQVYAANEFDPRAISREFLAEVKQTARDCHQTFAALCGDLGGYGFEKAEDNAARLDYIRKVVDMAQYLDCHVITTHIGVVPKDKSIPRYRIMCDAMHEAGKYAAAHDCTIAVETGPEKITTLAGLVDEAGEGLGINYDPANLLMVSADDPIQGVYDAGSRIVHTHAKDGIKHFTVDPEEHYHMFAEGGLDWSRQEPCAEETPLGQGQLDWQKYLHALKDVGFDGFLTIEREVTNGAADIVMAVDFLKEQIAKM